MMAAPHPPLVSVRDLSVCYPTRHGDVQALQRVCLHIHSGKTLALLGESGCGKSTLGRVLLGLLAPPGRVTQGSICLATPTVQDVTRFSESAWRALRGRQISLILQDPVQALNPVMSVGAQMVEALQAHREISPPAARSECRRLLERLRLQAPERVLRAYPFQLSGGMCQRVAIAIALANNAKVLVADEPTTALDVGVQAAILALIKTLQKELELSLLLITHDIGVAAEIGDDVAVMYAGRIIEAGSARCVLRRPAHPYTRGLLDCYLHDGGSITDALTGQPPNLLKVADRCPFLPRCPLGDGVCANASFPAPRRLAGTSQGHHHVACHHPLNGKGAANIFFRAIGQPISVSSFAADPSPTPGEAPLPLLEAKRICKRFSRQCPLGRRRSHIVALDEVSLSLRQGEVLGIVGESGCGKTTLARCILGLEQPDAGEIRLNGEDLLRLKGEKRRRLRQFMQPVFQSPRGSLNPGRTALELVQEPLLYFQRGLAAERRRRARWLLDQVGFDAALMERKPNALSTGQCQRVAIARALVIAPRLLICDEPLCALDLSVQAQILSLLAKLHRRLKFGMVLISHNIRVVRSISNRIVVMHQGRICETLACGQGGKKATHPYTKTLFEAVPQLW
jgi:peptide/nickel transport system ATP-binding protein